MGCRRVPERQRTDRISPPLCAAGRRTSTRIGSDDRRLPVQRRSALDSAGLPQALLKATPRHVEVNTLGGMMMLIAALLVGIGMWGGIVLNRRAETAGRHVSLFASDRIVTAGDVIQLRKRGGDNDHRITAHYRYAVRGRELTGQTTLRRGRARKISSRLASRGLVSPNRARGELARRLCAPTRGELAGDGRAARMRRVRDGIDSRRPPTVKSARPRAAGHGDRHEGREEKN